MGNNKLAMMFDQGQVPKVVLVDATEKEKLGFSVNKLAAALKRYLAEHFTPIWGVTCVIGVSKGQQIPHNAWAIVLLDNPDVAGAMGYHELTPDGMPLSKVFVGLSNKYGEPVSVTVSHELVEMLVDPGIQMIAQGPNGIFYAYEVADAVQGETFEVGGFPMTNFMYPAWFEEFRVGTKEPKRKYDHLGNCIGAFVINAGGYMPVMKRGKWTQIFGSKETKKQFVLEHHPRTLWRTDPRVLGDTSVVTG